MASQRIKGITIEIGGDTTELTKALTSVDKAVKETQANLRDVNKALKFDTGNVELLKNKQQLLNDSVDLAKQKLQAEKDALDQMKQSDGFDANSKAAKDLQTQIQLDEVELKKAEEALKEFGSVGQQQMKLVAEKVKAVGDKISNIGEGMTKTITAPIAGIGAASVAAWQEVDGAMDIVITKTGATGEALEDMQSRVTSIAETIPTSFEKAGTAVGEVNTRFGLTGDALEDLATKFIQFSELNGTDVNNSIDIVQKAMNAFNIEAKDAGAFLDTLNKVGQDTGISMDSLSQLMVSNATAFKGLNLNAADSAALLGKLEKSGVDTSVVITGLSKVQKAAVEDGVSMEQALTSALTDAGTAVDVFGSKAGVKLYESFQSGVLSVDDFVNSTASLNDALGSVSDTYDATLDPLDQMTVTMNTLKQTGADIVNAAAPMLTQVLSQLAVIVKQLSEAWNNLTPAQQEMIIKFAAIAAAVGPILIVIGKVVAAIGTLMPILSAIGAAITGVVIPAIAAISAPVLAVVAAIAAVVAAIVLVAKHWDEIKEKTKEVVEEMSRKWDEFKNNLSNKWNSIKQKTSETTQAMNEKWQQSKEKISTAVSNIAQQASNKFSEMKSNSLNRINELRNNALNVFSNLHSGIASVISNVRNTIVNGFSNAISYITSLPSQAAGWGRDIINGVVNGIYSAFHNLIDAVSDIASTIASYIHFSEPDVGALRNFHEFMPDMMGQLAQGIENGIPQIENAMDTMTRSMIPTMGSASGDVGATNNTNNTVSINVYGAQGQDVNELARIIENKITDNVVRRGVAFG